ncbi:MAG: hypothetical protein ACYC1D_04835 [Acidimicrobiales bacterium]
MRSPANMRQRGPRASIAASLVSCLLLLSGAGVLALSWSPAAGAAATTCPTVYGGSTVPCSSTTTTGFSLNLTIGYANGVVTWKVCGTGNVPSSFVGTTEQLFLNGVAITQAGGTGVVQSNDCTAPLQFSLCLPPGNFAGEALDQGFPPADNTLVVTVSGCSNPVNPITLTGSINNTGATNSGATSSGATNSGATSSGATGASSTPASNGTLAFTGANVLRLILAALMLIALGYAIVRLNRRRRHAA